MDRKAWIAVVLSVAGLFGWQWWYQKTYGEALAQQRGVEAQERAATAASPTPAPYAEQPGASATPVGVPLASPGASPAPANPLASAPATPAFSEETLSMESDALEYTFTTRGGGIARIALRGHTSAQDGLVVINGGRPVAIGAIGTRPEEMGLDQYRITERGPDFVTLEAELAAGFKVTKRFNLASGGDEHAAHVTAMELTFANTTGEAMRSSGYFLAVGGLAPLHDRDLATYTGFDYQSEGKSRFQGVNWFAPSRIPLVGIETRGARPFFLENTPALTWAGVKNQYFTSVVWPMNGLTGDRLWAMKFEVPPIEGGTPRNGVDSAMAIPAFDIPAGGSVTHSFGLYAGPKKYQWLHDLGSGQEAILNYGIFRWVSIGLLSAMNWLKSVLHSYALAIIVLTLIIKTSLWPLQNKATASMRKMSALSPKMTELREKYKDDPTRMNQELMKLYKDYGVNPFGGCLPMMVQIPVFFGFYSMLGTAVELRNSSFFWVNDLSQPDTVFHVGSIPVNILPLVMAATMLWQMKITPKTGDAVQQRIFLFMPLIFLVFCYNFASALALYWTVQNLFSIVQLYLTRDKPIPALTKITPPGADNKKKRKRN